METSYAHYDTEKLNEVIHSHLGENTVEEIKLHQVKAAEEEGERADD